MTALRALTKPRSEVVTLAKNDLPEVAAFIARESGKGPPEIEAHLSWFLLENPARNQGIPLGWGLRGEHGKLAGCLLSSPQDFRFRTQLVPVMGSTCFYVDSAHRSAGALIFLKYSRLTDRWALFGNSANAEAASLWKGRGATPIPDSDRELLGPIRWGPMLEDVIFRKTGRSNPSRVLGKLGAGVASVFRHVILDSAVSADLVPLTSAEDAAELTTSTLPEQLTSVRDVPYLRWRYFSKRDPSAALFAFRARGMKQPLFVAVNERPKGHRNQIHALSLLDIYPPPDPQMCLQVVSALNARYLGRIDLIVLRCLDSNRRKVFQQAGFLERKFDAPNGWFLDKNNLLPAREWYSVPGDGDWII